MIRKPWIFADEILVKHIWILLLLSFTPPLLFSKAAFAQSPAIAYVYRDTASLWREPGYSWRNCKEIHEKDAITDFNVLVKTSENCNRTILQGGDEVTVLTDGKNLKSADRDLIINGKVQKMTFYNVEVTVTDADGKTHREKGWISADQLTQPEQDQEAAKDIADIKAAKAQPSKAPPKPNCPPGHKNPLVETSKHGADIQSALETQAGLGAVKSDAEINHFLCIYRKAEISNAQFDQMIPQFSAAAKKAEGVFKIPYGVTMCTMLIESGLYYNASEKDEYKGLGQFGSATIEDLGKYVKDSNSTYGQKWNQYTRSKLTDEAVRQSENPEVATGAVALMLNWLYEKRLPASGCRACSTDNQFNRRDLYLMIAGYNYSPYAINKFANNSLAKLQTSYPPPRETRNYMTQMDRCLKKGQDRKFRVGKDDKSQVVSQEYKDRKKSCDQKYPVK